MTAKSSTLAWPNRMMTRESDRDFNARSFCGNTGFPSPEQFAGVQVDIRSDLYSLGATLWKMLTGQAPFRGTSAELMHQHCTHRYRSRNSKVFRSRWLFSWRCCWRKTRRDVSRTRPNF